MTRKKFDPHIYNVAKAEAMGMEWTTQAACKGTPTGDFFPERGYVTKATEAKKVCWTQCPVRVECEEYALVSGEKHGIWGGRSEEERRKLKARRRNVA